MRDVREEEEEEEEEEDFNTSTTTCMAGSSNSTTSSSSWSRFKDPRIVRVSRAFGGKDRHSKVCTVRGLRDRRVRLSVPTAIQLYDLQDRLGLNQPSKVVDWLLNVAKHEIDELPPLRFPVDGSGFGQNLHQHNNLAPAFDLEFGSGSHESSKEGRLKIGGSAVNWDDSMKYSKADVFLGKSKDFPGGKSEYHRDGSWPRNHQERQSFNYFENQLGAFVNVSRPNMIINPSSSSSLPVFLDSNNAYNNQVFRWDPNSHLTLSQPSDQARQDLHNISLQMPIMAAGNSHQILVYQSGTSSAMLQESHDHFPCSNSEFVPKQLN
ncbi:uncharacterized protein [Henckelia pumila]|uniref:uncharacterized protein n=1 Tax=Henckelia pumila TaxID=405737 RepID=UPI003C6E6F65